jgi:hypothetical protein
LQDSNRYQPSSRQVATGRRESSELAVQGRHPGSVMALAEESAGL